MDENREKHVLPGGEYVLADPCYVAKENIWGRMIDAWTTMREKETANENAAYIPFEKGAVAALFTTAFGDGGFPAESFDGIDRTIGVDSGTVGLIDIRLCDRDKVEAFINGECRGDALLVQGPVVFSRENDGRLVVTALDAVLFAEGKEVPSQVIATVHTDPALTYDLDRRYDILRMNWLSANVEDEVFLDALCRYATKMYNDSSDEPGPIFEKWLEENGGFNGKLWPDFEEVDKTTLPWNEKLEGHGRLTRLLADMDDFEEFMLYCHEKATKELYHLKDQELAMKRFYGKYNNESKERKTPKMR